MYKRQVIGSIIGMLIGVIRTIPKGERGAKKVILTIINAILNAYVEFFRGTPMIVQAMVIYYGSDLAFGIDMDRTFAAIFIVSINTGAYTVSYTHLVPPVDAFVANAIARPVPIIKVPNTTASAKLVVRA